MSKRINININGPSGDAGDELFAQRTRKFKIVPRTIYDITESLDDRNPVGTSIWRSPVTRATCDDIDEARLVMRALAAKAVE